MASSTRNCIIKSSLGLRARLSWRGYSASRTIASASATSAPWVSTLSFSAACGNSPLKRAVVGVVLGCVDATCPVESGAPSFELLWVSIGQVRSHLSTFYNFTDIIDRTWLFSPFAIFVRRAQLIEPLPCFLCVIAAPSSRGLVRRTAGRFPAQQRAWAGHSRRPSSEYAQGDDPPAGGAGAETARAARH
ncbi:hypothetical protein C8R47DRAFT_1168875 [Mycena vitilis]|nr:hypothetical protein C8R47DRAFT_1168875 [Mycena vitilis]